MSRRKQKRSVLGLILIHLSDILRDTPKSPPRYLYLALSDAGETRSPRTSLPGNPHSQNAARGNDSPQAMYSRLASHRFNCRPGQTTDRSRSTSLTSCPTFLLISPHRTETLFSLSRALHTCGWGSRAKSPSYTRTKSCPSQRTKRHKGPPQRASAFETYISPERIIFII